MMLKFGLILVLLLAKTLAQEELEPIFKTVGETLELGFCFAVDYLAVYRINEGENQLLWNSSYSVPPPDSYKNRIDASNTLHGLLGVQITDLKPSDTGVYLRECWENGNISSKHINYVYICEVRIPDEELLLKNKGALLSCDISSSEVNTTNIKWFREVNPGYKISLFLDTEKSQVPLQEELDHVLQVQDKGFSLYISEAGLEHSQHFFCLVMKMGQCKSFKTLSLPESHNYDMHTVYYAVGEKAALSCLSKHQNQQENYWTTPNGEVDGTTPHSQMYISRSKETKDDSLIIPSITFNHSGEYICLSKATVVEYFINVCAELVSDHVQLYNGGNVSLACTLTQDDSVSFLWYRQKDQMEAQLIYDSGDPSIDMPADMEGRTTILTPASLMITGLNEMDSGTYWCVVLLDSMEQDIDDDSFEDIDGDYDMDDDDMDDDWIEDEENTETCVSKMVTELRIRPNNFKRKLDIGSNPNSEATPEFSPVPYAIIGGVLGIVILGGIIVVVVVKMRAKRKTVENSIRADPTTQQKDSAVSLPLMD